MKRTLILAGRAIVIDALGQPLDQAFDRLFAAYSGNTPLPWEEFATAAMQYFDGTLGTWDAHDAYFNTFTIIWQNLLASGRFIEAEQLWERALQPALAWEQANPNQRLHKGTPYYFWGMTALLRGEMDHGYLLIHQGVSEDNKSFPGRARSAPGYALVSLDYDKPDQAFREWVFAQARYLESRIASYNATHARALTIDDVKRRFFQAPPNTEVVFLLTHTLARLMRLDKLPSYSTTNPFAGQLELNLLFDLTLVIEEAIKDKNPAKRQPNNKRLTFVHQAEYLLNTVPQPLSLLDAAGNRLCNGPRFLDSFRRSDKWRAGMIVARAASRVPIEVPVPPPRGQAMSRSRQPTILGHPQSPSGLLAVPQNRG